MKRTRSFATTARLLPLIIWVGWMAAGDRSEAPAAGASTGERQPAVTPLLEAPSLTSVRAVFPEGGQEVFVGSSVAAASKQLSTAALHLPGAALDPNLRGAVHPLHEQDSNRTRAPPAPLG